MKAAEFCIDRIRSPARFYLCVELQALWWVKKETGKEPDLAQDAGSMEGDWIHAIFIVWRAIWESSTGTLVLGSLSADKVIHRWQNIMVEVLDK